MRKLKINSNFFFIILVISLFTSPIFAQKNILISDVRIKAVDAKNGVDKYVNNIINEVFSAMYEDVNIVERNHLKEVEYVRKKFMGKSNTTKVANMQGATYGINSTLSDYAEKLGKNVFDDPESKSRITHYTMTISFKLDIEITDIETGEVVLKKTLSPNGWAYKKNNRKKELIEELLIRDAFIDMSYCFRKILRGNLYHFLHPEFEIIDISESKKGNAKKIIIASKIINTYSKVYNVFRKSVTNVKEKKIYRNILIGEVKLGDAYHKLTEFHVKKGGEDILLAFEREETIVITQQDPYFAPSCGSGTKSRINSKKAYESQKPKLPTAKTTEKKSKPRKKVQRK